MQDVIAIPNGKSLIASDLELQLAFDAVRKAIESAQRKFPHWPDDMVHGAAIVAEESGELTQAALNHYYHKKDESHIYIEATHTACTAIRTLVFLARKIRGAQ